MRTGQKSSFARELRHRLTDAESRVWWRIRSRQLAGFKFRRQHPVGPYIADFICLEAGLVIELDGGQHLDSASDARRDVWFERQGYRVLRFWNNEALVQTEAVLEAILKALTAGSPQVGGRSKPFVDAEVPPGD